MIRREGLILGRKTKLTPDVKQLFIEAVSVGAPIKDACNFADINQNTFYEWMERAKTGQQPYADLADEIESARSKRIIRSLGQIAKHEGKDWKAAAWTMAVARPSEFGYRVKVQVEEELRGFLGRLRERLAPEVYEQVLAAGVADADRAGVGEDSPGAPSAGPPDPGPPEPGP